MSSIYGRWSELSTDLGLNVPYVKGQNVSVRNCWHFCTDGNAVDALFKDEDDFRYGMNQIFVMSRLFRVTILAFSLMDTHVHFVLHGNFGDCNRMMHEYLRRLSIHISVRYREHNKLLRMPLTHQSVDNDFYLKTVICYTIKNAPVAGLPYNAWDYPWSSGPLYFRPKGCWNSPQWSRTAIVTNLKGRMMRSILHSQSTVSSHGVTDIEDDGFLNVKVLDGLVLPEEYVAYEIVEKIFRTHRSFNYFMSITKDSDVDSRGGLISRLTVPMQEMRQHRRELSMEMFGTDLLKQLDMPRRIRLARALKSRYNSSVKQIARLCGLVYDEVKNML